MMDDKQLRVAAFDHVRRLSEASPVLTAADLKAGFQFEGERIPLVNPQRGIFKPRQMRFLLSIRTVFPKQGGKVWYDDQREAHRQIFAGEETVEYAFMGSDPNAPDNRWLREAREEQIPVLYFLGVSPGTYQAVFPTFIAGWDPSSLKARMTFGLALGLDVWEALPRAPDASERRYAMTLAKRRLHQATFREAVIAAYTSRCAVSGLAESRLLDAAHIIPDADEQMGQPVVPNGLLLSKIHHAAFDAQLIGIDPNYRVHVSEQLRDQRDGPTLEALKELHHHKLHLPSRAKDLPDRDRLAKRFEDFQKAA